jgi:phenylacetic acid degradation operon negative regulatory protein
MPSSRNTPPADELDLRPLTARSVVLSTLLGRHPPLLPVKVFTQVGDFFGIAEGTIRVAVSRMLAEGDLEREGDRYRLGARLVERQERQDRARLGRTIDWDGDWEMAVVMLPRRDAEDRASLRAVMMELRLAEIRDGVWLRPHNLMREMPELVSAQCERFLARPDGDPAALAARLWELSAWARRAEMFVEAMAGADAIAERIRIAAAIVRHLLDDPLLPEPLLPDRWPGQDVRRCLVALDAEVTELVVRLVPPPPHHRREALPTVSHPN